MCMKGDEATENDRKNEENMHERAILCIFAALKNMYPMGDGDIHKDVHTVGKCG